LPTFTKGKSQAGMRGDMVLEFDFMVGELVQALEKYDALENTLIIVTSDNGPQPGDPYDLVEKFRKNAVGEEYNYYQPYFGDYKPEYPGNGGLKTGWLVYGHNPTAGLFGFKADAWEGGLRVPFIISWPKKIKGNVVNSKVICSVDILATIAEITGEKLQHDEGEDSYSFLQNLLSNEAPQVRTSLTIVSGRSGAMVVRKGDWKYIEGADPRDFDPTEPYTPNNYDDATSYLKSQLYNLKKEIYEKNNLIDKMPKKVAELKGVIEKVKANSKSESQ
jgi:arylsulfatase A-like enzyme